MRDFWHKKTCFCRLLLHPVNGLLATICWVWWCRIDFSGGDNESFYSFHRHKSAATVYVCTLVIAFFGISSDIATSACMRCKMTLRTMKHKTPISFCEQMIPHHSQYENTGALILLLTHNSHHLILLPAQARS